LFFLFICKIRAFFIFFYFFYLEIKTVPEDVAQALRIFETHGWRAVLNPRNL